MAMGSPVSPIIVNIYMEYIDQEAFKICPPECKPDNVMWYRYVDGIIESIQDKVKNLTDHKNQVGKKNHIKFAAETEENNVLPVPDPKAMVTARWEDNKHSI